ncbi:MAG TPA: 50S ribosomal protein L9 [Coriobacteriia bacterium]
MKVILTAEVKGKGHEGDVVEVARGYAVNYLLPRKMAIEATSGNLKQLDARMSNIQKRNEARRTAAEGLAEALNGKSIVIEAKSGDEGRLFGSVTTLMIEEAIAAQLGQDVDHKRMDLSRPIKALGDHPVRVSVFGDVKAEVVVRVVPEGGAQAPADAAAPKPQDDENPAEATDGIAGEVDETPVSEETPDAAVVTPEVAPDDDDEDETLAADQE